MSDRRGSTSLLVWYHRPQDRSEFVDPFELRQPLGGQALDLLVDAGDACAGLVALRVQLQALLWAEPRPEAIEQETSAGDRLTVGRVVT